MADFPTKEHIDAAKESADYWFQQVGFYSFPSFRLAQTGVESANGTHLSGNNNYWGVKANNDQIAAGQYRVCLTHEEINGKNVAIYAKFASYLSLKDGYIAQAKLLVTSKYYEKSRHDNNPKQYAIDVAVKYATAHDYAQVIIAYMDEHDLYQYDRPTSALPAKLKPPISEVRKGHAPATGAVVVTAATAAVAANGHPHIWALLACLGVAGVFAAFAVSKYSAAHVMLAKILTPPSPKAMPSAAAPATPAAAISKAKT